MENVKQYMQVFIMPVIYSKYWFSIESLSLCFLRFSFYLRNIIFRADIGVQSYLPLTA